MTTAAPALQTVPAPSQAADRLLAIDVTRGFALLGIFFVNIQSFAEPFGRFVSPIPESDDPLTRFWFYFVHIFCMGKFYPLFSMLFGMGLALQMHSVFKRGGQATTFYALYLRRLVWLFLMGLSHALLLWYGDILFIYSIAGTALLLCARIPPKIQLAIGVGLVLFASVFFGAISALGGWAAQQKPEAPAQVESAATPDTEQPSDSTASATPQRTPIQQVIDGFFPGGPETPDAIEGEIRAMRDGPWLQSFFVRGFIWLNYLVFCLLGFGWHVLGMFFIGAGMLRSGIFEPSASRVQWVLFSAGLLIGVPGAVVQTFLPAWGGVNAATMGASAFLGMFCGPLVSLFYLMSFTLIVRGNLLKPATFVLSNVGRMALTNYLTHTLVSTFVFYHWGLAQFGEWTRAEQCAFVLTVFACQCVFSVLWMRTFRFGPAEWLWRSVTYLRPQPMLRTAGPSPAV